MPDLVGVITTFSFDTTSHVLTVTTAAPGAKPDLSVAAAFWIDDHTIGYPVNLRARMVAIGVYDDADRLIDATSVQAP